MQLLPERFCLRSLPAMSFATLMELYESNYIRFRRLAPHLDALPNSAILIARGEPDLHLTILGRARFTTTVMLAHASDESDAGVAESHQLCLRVYHDARMAEALPQAQNPLADEHVGDLVERWKRNRFLYKWLAFNLARGYRFSDGAKPRAIFSSSV
jgi:uncharacterized protein